MNEIEIFDLPSEPRESAHERIQGLREQIVTGELDNLIVEPGGRGMRGLFVATLDRISDLRQGDGQERRGTKGDPLRRPSSRGGLACCPNAGRDGGEAAARPTGDE